MQLNYRRLREIRIVLHAFGDIGIATCLQRGPLSLIKRAAGADMKRPGKNGDILIIWMRVRRDPEPGWHLQADDINTFFRRIAFDDRQLCSLGVSRGRDPFQGI